MIKLTGEVKRLLKRFGRVAIVLIAAYFGLFAYARYYSSFSREIELGTDSEDYRFTYDISKSWSEVAHGFVYGSQCDLEVENKTEDVLIDWAIELELSGNCEVDSSWNGNFEVDDTDGDVTRIRITKVEFNDTVTAKELQPFGMVVYSGDADFVKSGRFTYRIEMSLRKMKTFWILLVITILIIMVFVEEIVYTAKSELLRNKQRASRLIINQSFITFASIIDAKDSYTKGHSQRVAFYSRELAKRIGLDEDFQESIFYVGLLHDIGKIGVQDAILNKNDKLTADEFNEIKEHVSMGGDILKNFNAIEGIEAGAIYHHEKYDGTGYMEGLKGEEIPLLARIIAVADAFDAMSSERCYRRAMENDRIIEELRRCSGTQFDPEIVPYMISMIREKVAPIELEEGQLEHEFELDK